MSNRVFSLAAFILVSLLIIGSILFYAPSWGLMDDYQMLKQAEFVWSGGNFLGNLGQIFMKDIQWGMFRPVFYTWVVFVYHFFQNSPLLIYLGIAIFNLFTLLLWGLILNRIWLCGRENFCKDVFLFPLTFFIFTPFWNNFMYISVQQKFIIFFSALAIYSFYLGFLKEKKRYFIFSVGAVLLSTLNHGEGIFLNLALLLLTLTLFFTKKKKGLLFSFVLNLILLAVYSLFTLLIQLKGVYTSKYAANLTFNSLTINFFTAPGSIKILFFFSVVYFFILLLTVIKKKNKFSPVFLVFPLGFICFIAVLAPWGFPTYHLSVLTPFIMGMFFPLYLFLNSRALTLKVLTNAFLLVLVLIVFFFIWIPRISKVSDIKKTEQFIIGFEKKQNSSIYFMAQPCMEACDTLGAITKTKIIYLSDSLLSSDKLIESVNNFVIFRDECPMVYFDGVQELKEIYQNSTWKIFSVNKIKGIKKGFKVKFPENPVGKIKTFLKK